MKILPFFINFIFLIDIWRTPPLSHTTGPAASYIFWFFSEKEKNQKDAAASGRL